MKIFRYWASETRILDGTPVHSKAGSNVSQTDALKLLDEKFAFIERFYNREDISASERQAARLRFSGGRTDGEYESPVCEEFVRELDAHNIITRNRYGALVLNSEDHCFIDVDNTSDIPCNLPRILGRTPSCKEQMLLKLEQIAARPKFSELAFRLYETAAGFRILVKGDLELSPQSELVTGLFCAFESDPLYELLCVKQNCFRARLTPKPGRIGVSRTGFDFHYPYANPIQIKQWILKYEEALEKFAVCRLAGEFGRRFTTPVTEIHDKICGTASKLKLA